MSVLGVQLGIQRDGRDVVHRADPSAVAKMYINFSIS